MPLPCLLSKLTVICVLACAGGGAAIACTTPEMTRTSDGFIRKIVSGSDQVSAHDSPEEGTQVFVLDLLQPYFVICETETHLRVTDIEALSVAEAEAGLTGYVRKDQIYDWPTREAVAFSDLAFLGNRPEIVAWDDREVLTGFMASGDETAFPPTFRENIDATLRRTTLARPYPRNAPQGDRGHKPNLCPRPRPHTMRATEQYAIHDPVRRRRKRL